MFFHAPKVFALKLRPSANSPDLEVFSPDLEVRFRKKIRYQIMPRPGLAGAGSSKNKKLGTVSIGKPGYRQPNRLTFIQCRHQCLQDFAKSCERAIAFTWCCQLPHRCDATLQFLHRVVRLVHQDQGAAGYVIHHQVPTMPLTIP